MVKKVLIFITMIFSNLDAVEFFAYEDEVKDAFDEACILCTPSAEYAATIAFTKHWKVTYWINQAYLGRSLITAQRHFGSYEEMTDEEADEYREILRIYLPALKRVFGAAHFNVAFLMNQAYREEKPDPHFHWHVIPRYSGPCTFAGEQFEDPDFGNAFDFNRKHYPTGEFQRAVIEAIREELDIQYISLP